MTRSRCQHYGLGVKGTTLSTVIRRSFRIGLWLGLLTGIGALAILVVLFFVYRWVWKRKDLAPDFFAATKYFFETGSDESRKPAAHFHLRVARMLLNHSLTIVLRLTGIAWIVVYAHSEVNSTAGQVIGSTMP